MHLPLICIGGVDHFMAVDLKTQLRGGQYQDIHTVEFHHQVIGDQIEPDTQVPPEASQVLDALGSEMLFAY